MKKKRGAKHASPQTSDDALPRRLYTLCPNCQTVYRVTVAQLRAGHGKAECQGCQTGFNVLDTLAETPTRARPDSTVPHPILLGQLDAVTAEAHENIPTFSELDAEPSPEKLPSRAERLVWVAGVVFSFVLLIAQFIAFEGPQLTQNPRVRPWLETTCEYLNCRLPPFHALQQIQTLTHDLHPTADEANTYEFTLVFVNQAELPQAFPALKLTLISYDNNPIAGRIFQPEEYLSNPHPNLMAVGEAQTLHLLLTKPKQDIAGFLFTWL
jgi:predicted Zn finger-like uncharacterized protein